jgi:mono/diheme cytochrome c family protein
MHIFKLSIFITGIALFIFGCAGNNTPPPAPPANAGNNSANVNAAAPAPPKDELAWARNEYKEHCAKCHRDNGEGGTAGSARKPNKTIDVPSFKRASIVKDPDEELIEQIAMGSDEMPGYAEVYSPEQMKDLVKFIRKEFQGK